jgi:hypothetical protein
MLCPPKDTYKPKGRLDRRQRSLGISRLIQRPPLVPLLEEEDDYDVILLIQGLRDGRLTKIVASDCSVDQSAYDPAYLSRHKYDRGCKLGRLCPRRPCLQTGVPGGGFSDVSQCVSPRRARIVVDQWTEKMPTAWWDVIANYVKGRDQISIEECAVDQMCLAMAEADLSRGVRIRIGRVLRAIGWEGHYRRMENGKTGLRFRRYGSRRHP